MKNFDFIRVSLTILIICSIMTFIAVWKVLYQHNRNIRQAAKNDINFIWITKDLDKTINSLEYRITNLESEIALLKAEKNIAFTHTYTKNPE